MGTERKERIDVRVEPEILEELEAIALLNGITGRSQAVREAVYHYIDTNKDSWNSDNIHLSIPKRISDKVQLFINNGDAKDVEQAIVLALDKWCAGLEVYYLSGRSKLEKAVTENIRSDRAFAELNKKTDKIKKR